VFRGGRLNAGEIYTMNADGTGLMQLTSTPSETAYPHWSPEGDKITFSHGNNLQFNRQQIYVMNLDGIVTQVTHNNLECKGQCSALACAGRAISMQPRQRPA
jgi:Tol biopolymer transport system component